jgi:hypothetical protein
MSSTPQPNEDDVLRRMLATPPENHKPLENGATRGRKPVEKPH